MPLSRPLFAGIASQSNEEGFITINVIIQTTYFSIPAQAWNSP